MPRLAPVRCLAAAVALLVAGCGDAVERGPGADAREAATAAATNAPRATSPGSPPDDPGRSTRRVRHSGGLTTTPVADYDGRVAISYRDGLLAVATGGPRTLQLRIAELGKTPRAAEGAGPLPFWARIHVGSNASGYPVVVYPRCRSARLASCDLYEWDPRFRRERVIERVSKPGRAEVEGVEHSGNVLFVTSRTPGAVVDQAAMLDGAQVTGTITLQQWRRSPQRILASGGYALSLNVGKIGFLQFRPSEPCGSVTARLVGMHDLRTRFRRQVFCDQEEGGEPVGAAIVAGQFMYGFTRTYEDASVVSHEVNTGPKRQNVANLRTSAVDYAPINGKAGYVVDGFGCDGRWEGPIPRGQCHLDVVSGLEFR